MTRDLPLALRRVMAAWLTLSLLVSLVPGLALAQDAEAGPTLVSGAFEAPGAVADEDLRYRWTVAEAGPWRIELEGPPEVTMRIELSRADGERLQLVDVATGAGLAMLNDLQLEPETWFLTVVRQGAEPVPFELRAMIEPERFDPEPNGDLASAVAIADGDVVRGRLGRTNLDDDVYRLRVPAGDVLLRDIIVAWDSGPQRRLCLLDADGRDRVCRSGDGESALRDLRLDAGDHFLEVDGTIDAAAPYSLRIEPAGAAAPDREAEPNDDLFSASPMTAELGVRGRSSRQDPDFHVVDIDGEAQLWRVRATGAQLERLSWVRGRDEVLAAVPGDDGAAQLADLYLVPGRHHFRVRTLGGDYRLEMTPLGPPDPEAEREPNNEDVRAQAYGIGERRTGRLVTPEDIDSYRFTLAAEEHLRLDLVQPDDALFQLRLHDSDGEAYRVQASEPGGALKLDLRLRPGDYLVSLRPVTPSEGRYELSSERLDPFVLAADQEPNEHEATARAAPPSLAWAGRGDYPGDVDATWLPPLDASGPVSIRLEGESPRVRIYAGDHDPVRLDVEQQEDGSLLVAEAPTAVPLYLEVLADADYTIALEAPGWSAVEPPEPLPVELQLDLPGEPVAAYWPEAQAVEGSIIAANAGAADVTLELEALTSHYAWSARPAAPTLEVPAGETRELPLVVDIRPDAWAGMPVRVSVAARGADGALVTAATELEATAEAAAVGASTGWQVPARLLGGLDVAGQAVGGEPLGSIAADREPLLYDGVTPEGAGFGVTVDTYPVDLVVDLAGEEPLPVRGTILNPLARGFILRQVPDEFELLLSTDGRTWEPVLRDRLQPLPIDQYFVLDSPIPATHAMLRIHTDHGDDRRSNVVALGEWKVIAEPGVVPETMPQNIAHPVRGGHPVRLEPFINSLTTWYGMLDDESRRQTLQVDRQEATRDDRFELVIGFQDGRAAQIAGLRWQDPDDSDEEQRLPGIAVEVSVDGPLGPWQALDDWELTRAPDGSVPGFELATPVWARYVRLWAPLDAEVRTVEAPARIEVLERPSGDGYRSILAEWGYTSRQGPFEWLTPEAASAAATEAGPDAGDTRETATALALATTRTDRAEILQDVDWYRVVVPPQANTLGFEVSGVPVPDVRLTLVDAAGVEVPTRMSPLPGGVRRYEADVAPGEYDLLVEQVPFNVAFTFDTSGSMGPFLDFVLEGMRAFTADVQPGREVVTVVPFGYGPLLDSWQDQPDILEDAVNNWVAGSKDSSDAERSMLLASRELATRDGTRAILVVTDAETGSFEDTPELWAAFEAVSPVVYSVHVGASNEAFRTRNLMRSWADANAGHYAFPATHAEMERAFERMSTRLRRPAGYTLTASAGFVDRSPGALTVTAPQGQPVELREGTGLALILDTSGSMNKRLEGKRRIDIAKDSMKQLVRTGLAEGTPVSLRIFGGQGKKTGCETRQLVPLGPLDKAGTVRLINKLRIKKNTGTPIAAALRWVKRDLESVEGERIVVLITDGKATCKADPEEALAELREEGITVSLNIVGFALDDEAIKEQMRGWAEANGGSFFDATSADALTKAVKVAVAARVDIFELGDDRAPVASTTVGAPAIELPPGSYRVEVLTDPPMVFDDIVIEPRVVETIALPTRSQE